MTDPVITGHTVFCDDIRVEVGGKLSLIGVYQAVMFVQGEFPITLPKFGLAVRYTEKIGACSDEVKLRVFLPGDAEDAPTIDGIIPVEEIRQSAAEERLVSVVGNEGNLPPVEYIHVGSNILFSPLVLKQPGLIRVRAFCGDNEIKLGNLGIRKTPPGTETKAQV
jgi:hypothetical protein